MRRFDQDGDFYEKCRCRPDEPSKYLHAGNSLNGTWSAEMLLVSMKRIDYVNIDVREYPPHSRGRVQSKWILHALETFEDVLFGTCRTRSSTTSPALLNKSKDVVYRHLGQIMQGAECGIQRMESVEVGQRTSAGSRR